MKTNLYADTPAHEREELIKGMADKSEMKMVRRFYSDDEKAQMKDYLSNETIQVLDQKEEFKEIKKTFNKAIDQHNKEIGKAAKDLKRGYSEQNETVYCIADHENDMMDIYDSKGEYLESRRMAPGEHQTKIMSMEKTGTHDV